MAGITRCFLYAAFILVSIDADARELSAQDSAQNIENLSLEELSKLKVYSASKKSEDPDTSPSSVYIITQEDLRQMGAMHIADALRTVPGMHVAKLNSSKWAISSRGFGEQFSNKLLVLMDGRPLYSTMYSGVFWDMQDIAMDNIKQIEVIRGPGATLWGANAVNGVINIITKAADETSGNHAAATFGDYYRGVFEGSTSQKLGKGEHYRTSVKYRNQGDTYRKTGGSNQDDWQSAKMDFRYDRQVSENESRNISSEIYYGSEDLDYILPSLTPPFSTPKDTNENFAGATLAGKWQQGLSNASDLLLEGYVNLDKRDLDAVVIDTLTTSLNAQHDWKPSPLHDISWGGGYTFIADHLKDSIYLDYEPKNRAVHFFNVFASDTIALLSEEGLFLTLGSKLEHNGYSGFEFQPSAKLSYQLNKNDLFWASVSRAVRTPSRGAHDLTLRGKGSPRGYLAQIGNSDFVSEKLIAYEAGYKTNVTEALYIDLTAFYNVYEDLRTFERVTPYSDFALPLRIQNDGKAENIGFEASAKYKANKDLNLWFGYSFIAMDLSLTGSVIDHVFLNDEKKTPQQQFFVRAAYRICSDLFLNNSVYYVDELPAIAIPAHTKWDANVAYELQPDIHVILAAENILDPRHPEYSAPLFSYPSEMPRSVFLKLEVDF